MIHGQYGQPYTFYTTTEEKRIDKAVPSSQIRFLYKFTNGMDRNVVYAYGQNQMVNNRYTKVTMTPNTCAYPCSKYKGCSARTSRNRKIIY